MEAFRAWLDLQLPRLPGNSKLAEDVFYALNRLGVLIRFLEAGRIDLDRNPIEPAIMPVALGQKISLFVGSDGVADSWAILASLIETAMLNDIEPYVWLRDVMTMVIKSHFMQYLDELLL